MSPPWLFILPVLVFCLWVGCARKTGPTLVDGDYVLTMKLSGLGPVAFARPDATEEVVLTVSGTSVVMRNKGPNALTGTLDGVDFVGTVTDAGKLMAFTGRLVADNVMAGSLKGTTLDGKPAVKGEWRLEPATARHRP